jgi:tRNA(Arg) A34 adenosine deaminase TadA
MNAMAGPDTEAATGRLTLWSTQQPCSMCRAAIDFIGVPTVVAIATDPSSPHDRVDEVLDDVWVVLATAMFLTGGSAVAAAVTG